MPPTRCLGYGLSIFENVLQEVVSMARAGAALLWLICNTDRLCSEGLMSPALGFTIYGKVLETSAVHRPCYSEVTGAFPLPVEPSCEVYEKALRMDLAAFCCWIEASKMGESAWQLVASAAMNQVAGKGRAIPVRKPTALQARALSSIRSTIAGALGQDFELKRSRDDAEKELSSRFMNYTGEEVPKMQVIGFKQVVAALPPETHAGSITATNLVSEGTRWFLENPLESLLPASTNGVKLQAKVHIHKGEEMKLCDVLVKRRICRWIPERDVLQIGGEKVLNGMFAVGKGTFLPSGEETQRLIMNLVPSNSVLRQAQGAVGELPAITQYLSTILDENEEVVFFQSDMSAAFYLFALPPQWSPLIAFNISFWGSEIGLAESERFHLACAVIPMGWGSAVSIMQEIADRLTTIGRLPLSHKVRKGTPLPHWLVEVLDKSTKQGRAWFHVYLDNFCSMEKVRKGEEANEGHCLHTMLEEAWEKTGVLSSAKKRVSFANDVQELGAFIHGRKGYMGASEERLLKLMQSTLVVISKRRLKKKWVQVVAGRWVHVLSFRRPGMVLLDWTWKYIAGKKKSREAETKTRSELFGCCCACLLLHTNLKAGVSGVTTASDASMSGGAVGMSTELRQEGQEFVAMDREHGGAVPVVPIMVLSLFNGVGCAFRCYDLCGVMPRVGLAYEISAAANRVTARRWPWVSIKGDVRTLTKDDMLSWKYSYPELQEIHLWGGFPCVDLSSVRAGRRNLEGPSSSLFWEIVRIIRELRQVFGFAVKVRFFAENVSSMDASAEQEISRVLGVKPLRLDSVDAVPIHRPRYCWTNVELKEIPGTEVVEEDRWYRVKTPHQYPFLEQWIEEGWVWEGLTSGVVLPTAMKAIKRKAPPLQPAGLNRVGADAVLRWRADDFRYPPYQYDDRFLFWKANKWRLASASERELLHGLGFDHTAVCWNAGDIKRDPEGYEDARKSLVGDSFNCFSFAYVAALACKKWVPTITYDQLWNRMGMAPGWSVPLHVAVPMERRLCYGSSEGTETVEMLHRCLLKRVNHTGSDIRVSTGLVVNPRSFPRQSAPADWWHWKKVFAYKWKRADHINSLELRSIVHAVEWRIKHLKECHVRVLHLTDSYVAMSIISKGRSSADLLQPLLRRLTAWVLSFGILLVLAHVESTENPTDADSRA